MATPAARGIRGLGRGRFIAAIGCALIPLGDARNDEGAGHWAVPSFADSGPPGLRWFGAAQRGYRLQHSQDLLQWTTAPEWFPGANLEITLPAATSPAFYRVALDSDGDGLIASAEASAGTSDEQIDSDGDGASDPFELAAGRDPAVDERLSASAGATGLQVLTPAPPLF